MFRRIVAVALIALATTICFGCSMFHRNEMNPQEQFMSALQHGNGPQMNQIWLNMSPEDRANMAHSQGFKPLTSPDEVKAKLQRAIAAKNHDADADGPTFAAAAGSEQQREIPTVGTRAGGLENLPGLSANSAPAQ